MSPFEAPYVRRCNTPISWDYPIDKIVVGPKLLREMEDQIMKIKQNLKLPNIGRKAMLIREKITENLKWVTMYS
jgi:hypothetical protein